MDHQKTNTKLKKDTEINNNNTNTKMDHTIANAKKKKEIEINKQKNLDKIATLQAEKSVLNNNDTDNSKNSKSTNINDQKNSNNIQNTNINNQQKNSNNNIQNTDLNNKKNTNTNDQQNTNSNGQKNKIIERVSKNTEKPKISEKIAKNNEKTAKNSEKIAKISEKIAKNSEKVAKNSDEQGDDPLDTVFGVETVDFAFSKNVAQTDIKLDHKWPVVVQLCSENLEFFHLTKMPGINLHDLNLAIIEALAHLCEDFIAITTIFVQKSNIFVILAPYKSLKKIAHQTTLQIGRKPPEYFAEKSSFIEKYKLETSDFDSVFSVASKIAAKLTANLALVYRDEKEVILFRARVSQLQNPEQCLDYLEKCKDGCMIKRRKGLAYVAQLIYSGFLLSSSKSEQMDFLLALDGSSNLLLADRMVKLSNFLTLGRQPYNMVTAVEILEV
eukprot:Phypoly_transcript_06820.p1 GENE.Phypoly_transcript_06820~~Phypoly_transcript_06820.p1  ORF type:complete len:442 (+),score=92.24 Phypoly_transcript_06820:371-1696(+)